MQVLRDYQSKAIKELREKFVKGSHSVIIYAPTGAGKTTISSHIIKSVIKKGRRVCFLAHRKELIEQCSQRLDQHGVDHGVIKSKHKRVNNLPVQVASVQTMVRRLDGLVVPWDFDLFVIDECHRAKASTYLKVLSYFPGVRKIGLSATPYRTDGKGLKELFDDIVPVSNIRELIEKGYLVPYRVFTTPVSPKGVITGVRKKGGDYDSNQLEERVNQAALVGDLVGHWKKLGENRRTVIFAVTIRHGEHIKELFLNEGIPADFVDGKTPDRERDRKLSGLANGDIKVLVNVGILTEGWDLPSLSCIVLARPTLSKGLYKQMVGRGLRTHEGKEDCLILDHAGNTHRFGLVDEPEDITLDGVDKKEKKKQNAPSVKTCEKCFAIYQGDVCPECGAKPKVKEIKVAKGDLEEYKKERYKIVEKKYLKQALIYSIQRNSGHSLAARMFKDKFGKWPGKEHGAKWSWTYRNGQKVRSIDLSSIEREFT